MQDTNTIFPVGKVFNRLVSNCAETKEQSRLCSFVPPQLETSLFTALRLFPKVNADSFLEQRLWIMEAVDTLYMICNTFVKVLPLKREKLY